MKRTGRNNININNENHRVDKKQKYNYHNNLNTLLYALFLAFFSAYSSYYFIPDPQTFVLPVFSKFIIYLVSSFMTLSVFYAIFKKPKSLLKYFFFLIILAILIIAISQQISLHQKNQQLYHSLSAILKTQTIAIIIIGYQTIRLFSNEIYDTVNDVKERASKKITFQSLFSKKELPVTILFILILGFGSFNLFYRLDKFDLYSDEAQVTQGAAGYLKTGEYRQYHFGTNQVDITKFYNRAKPHQFILAQSYKIFGISTWSSRFPSAIFGVLFLLVSYFVARYFLRLKTVSILTVLAFAFFFEFLFLQRWARMYAILFPFFLLSFLYAYKFLSESKIPGFLQKYSFVHIYLDFNYYAGVLFVIFFYIAYHLHENSLILPIIFFLFSIFSFLKLKKKKYLVVVVAGCLVILYQFIFPFDIPYRWISFFKIDHNDIYSQLFFYYPFSMETGIIVLLLGIALLINVKNEEFVSKLSILIITIITALILYSFVIDFNVSFRYMSFIAPIIIMTILFVLFFLIKSIYKPVVSYIISFITIASIGISFAFKYDDLYVKNSISPARPSVAWKIINQEYKPGEALFIHWGPSLYLDSIDPNVKILELHSFRDNKFSDILDSMKQYPSGWITWHTHNGDNVHKKLREYCRIYMKKYHGYGVDETGVEVYHYVDSLLKPYDVYQKERNFPVANIKRSNPFSLAFLIKINENNSGQPFFFLSDSSNFKILINEKGEMNWHFSNQDNDSSKVQIPNNEINHVVLYSSGGNTGNTYGIILNGEKAFESKLLKPEKTLLKFKVNPQFTGYLNDIRLYPFVLNSEQINEIIRTKGRFGSDKLLSDGVEFSTLFHWQK